VSISTEHADQLTELLTQATNDLLTYGPTTEHLDNGNHTAGVLASNIATVNRLLQYANHPPTFSYFLHQSPYTLYLNGSPFATIQELSIHT
jgi:hypothetical protein